MRIPRMFYILALMLGMAFVAALPDATAAPAAQAGPTTWTVMVGGEVGNEPTGKGSPKSWQLLRFFPGTITINKGDTIRFVDTSSDPHNALFPKVGEPPPPFEPAPPTFELSAQIVLPAGGNTYDGTKLVNTGLFNIPNAGSNYSITYTATGTFDYLCSIHGGYNPQTKTLEGMAGRVIVQEAGMAYPMTQAQIDAAARASLATAETATKAAEPAAKKITHRAGPNGTMIHTMNAGAFVQAEAADYMRYGATDYTITAGDTVEWNIIGFHTVTFTSGAPYPSFVKVVPQSAGPPKFIFNVEDLSPKGGKVYSGSGFFSSGAPLGPPPDGASGPPPPYALTFDKPGTYEYACLLHTEPGMFGRIKVNAKADTRPLPNTGISVPTLNFPATGYGLGGAFLNFWKNNGDLAVFGMPIDSERQTDGQVYQWLERNRLELHPENSGPYTVLLGRLGAEMLEKKGIDWTLLPKVSSAPAGCAYYAQTGHSVCGDFLAYWKSHGLEFDGSQGKSYAESLALFGLPLSEPRLETNSSGDTVMTQWFERARFEYHPNNPSQYRVLLGRLGAEIRAYSPSQE